jgi:hypothetical protein
MGFTEKSTQKKEAQASFQTVDKPTQFLKMGV